eukprot:scaffold567049_cov41-Prasinocladus_malaysianus.AAC.1
MPGNTSTRTTVVTCSLVVHCSTRTGTQIGIPYPGTRTLESSKVMLIRARWKKQFKYEYGTTLSGTAAILR